MKTSTFISTVALLVSMCALYLGNKHSPTVGQENLNAIIDARIAARELEIAQGFAPNVRKMLGGMYDSQYGDNWSPKKFEELMEPLARVISAMGKVTPSQEEQKETEQGGTSDCDKPTN